jgi:hypothetical protein
MFVQDRRAITTADALQAECWRDWLAHERSESALKLSKHKKRYERYAGLVDPRKLRQLCGAMRSLEHELRTIDHMIEALARRFTDEMQVLPRV